MKSTLLSIPSLMIVTGLAIADPVEDEQSRDYRTLTTSGIVNSIAWSSDGSSLAVQTKPSKDKPGEIYTVSIWDAKTGRLRRTISETNEPTFSAIFSPDGESISCVVWARAQHKDAPDGEQSYRLTSEIRTWDTATGKLRMTIAGVSPELGLKNSSDLLAVAYAPDGQTIAACSKLVEAGDLQGTHIGGAVCLWDARSGRVIWHDWITHTDIIYAIAFSPDGRTFASGGIDKLIRLWDTKTGKLEKTLFGVGWDGVCSLAFSPDGAILATGGSGREEGGRVRQWDVKSGKLLRTINGFARDSNVRISYSPDGETVFAIAQTSLDSRHPSWQVRSWNARTGESRRRFAERPGFARRISISPDGEALAVGTGSDVLLYKTNP